MASHKKISLTRQWESVSILTSTLKTNTYKTYWNKLISSIWKSNSCKFIIKKGNKNKRKIKEWESWVYWTKIKIPLLLMPSLLTTNIHKWKINSPVWSTLQKSNILNLMTKTMLSKHKGILYKDSASNKNKKISNISFMLTKNLFKIMIS